jgi:hypothetical protein
MKYISDEEHDKNLATIAAWESRWADKEKEDGQKFLECLDKLKQRKGA